MTTAVVALALVALVCLMGFGIVALVAGLFVRTRPPAAPFERHEQPPQERVGRSPTPQPPTRRVAPPATAPTRSVAKPSSKWVPRGEAFTVAGYVLADGFVYVGERLKAAGHGGPEPALINPTLKVDRSKVLRTGEGMSYWPSYGEIAPGNRAAYLEWLASGRNNPEAYIGYVFLYFYGLERRVLIDAEEDRTVLDEMPHIVAEVERLLGIYGQNGSFSSYAGGFLQVCHWRIDPSGASRHDSRLFGWEIPFSLRVALARCASEARPVPGDLAFAWLMNGPDACRRTPATRCTSELTELFRVRYRGSFGEGITIRKGRAQLKLDYRPATSSIGRNIEVLIDGLKDAARQGPPSELKTMLDRCVEDLDPYSRWLGRRKPDQPLLAGLTLLPADLLQAHEARELADLRTWLSTFPTEAGPAVIEAADLFARWPDARDGKLTKAESTAMAAFLQKLGYGVEPDVRFLGTPPTPTGTIVLFRQDEGAHSTVSPEYAAASTLLHFASAVAAVDGVDLAEIRFLTDHVGTVVGLADGERTRLAAHLLWLLREPPAAAKLKKLAESIPADRRAELAQFLVCVAGADGGVSRKEIALLAKLYVHLGLDEKMVYAHLHGLGSDASAVGEPVTVKPAPSSPPPTFSIPRRPEPTHAGQGGPPHPAPPPEFRLDMARVQARLHESAAISAVLADIFKGQDEAPPPIAAPPADPVANLDAAHSTLVRKLASAATWTRPDWNQLCASLGLLPDGAVDTVNEAALDACGDVLLAGDDPIEVDSGILAEMTT